MKKCKYCIEFSKQEVCGISIRTDDFKHTAGYLPAYQEIETLGIRIDRNYLDMFILKGKSDEKAGLMVKTHGGDGYRYVEISYCPFCGRYLNEI